MIAERHVADAHLRLTIPKDKLYGREDEIVALTDSYNRMLSENASKIVLIKASSGVGKSRLVRSFRDDILARRSCYFVSGKADENVTALPCAPLVDAFSRLCDEVVERGGEEMLSTRTRILEAVGGEGQVLVDLIPGLACIIGEHHMSTMTSKADSINRLEYVFAKMVAALITKDRPLVLFLDDLQWIDKTSLDLLVTLTTEKSIKHFMFIGAYRSNEVDSEHGLKQALRSIGNQAMQTCLISLENLTLTDVKSLVSDALRAEPDEVESLTKLIFEKTNGNVFYVLTSLHVLAQKAVLSYSYVESKWTWDVQHVDCELLMSDNVVSMVVARLTGLSSVLQEIMITAAFLRATFHATTLCCLLTKQKGLTLSKAELISHLDVAVHLGFLTNSLGSLRYTFVHDRIQEAALMLMKAENRDARAVQTGLALLDICKVNLAENGLLFVAVDILNASSERRLRERMEAIQLAKLNFEVGNAAAKISAYTAARKYVLRGISIVKDLPDRWTSHYSLSLPLYSTAADIEFSVGSFLCGKQLADEVLKNAVNFDDKLPTYRALAAGMYQKGRHQDAFAIDVSIARTLGVLPKNTNTFSTVLKVRKLSERLRRTSDSDILGRLLTDKQKIETAKSLVQLSMRGFYLGKMMFAVCCHIQSLWLMLNDGFCAESAFALSSFGGFLVSVLNDCVLGRRLGNLALAVIDLVSERHIDTFACYNVASFIESWFVPLPQVMKLTYHGYRTGMLSGNVTLAMLSFNFHSQLAYAAGLPLGPTIEDLELTNFMMSKYDIEMVQVMFVPFRQLLLGLAGKLDDPLEEIECGLERFAANDNSLTFGNLWKYYSRSQLAYYFGEFQLADEMQTELRKYINAHASYIYKVMHYFFACLIATAMYRERRSRKYKSRATNMIQLMEGIVKTRGINVVHKLQIMKAEYLATFDNKNDVAATKGSFDTAIASATRSGFMQDAAIANELAGEYFLRRNDLFWAKHYLEAAYHQFVSWGANGKAASLVKRRYSLIGPVNAPYNRMRRMSVSRKPRDALINDGLDVHDLIDASRWSDSLSGVLSESQTSATGAGSYSDQAEGAVHKDRWSRQLKTSRPASELNHIVDCLSLHHDGSIFAADAQRAAGPRIDVPFLSRVCLTD